MTLLAIKLTLFAQGGKHEEAVKFLNYVENAFQIADDTVTNYLYTDFLVTIMEQKKEQREYLKSIMGIKTKNITQTF
jgi:hypothetical protein